MKINNKLLNSVLKFYIFTFLDENKHPNYIYNK